MMTIEINANVLAQPREALWLDEYPAARVFASYNVGDAATVHYMGGQTIVGHTVLNMEVCADNQRVFSSTDATVQAYSVALDDLVDVDRYVTKTHVQVAVTDNSTDDQISMDTTAHVTILP
jgi:hypothetical protein